jgi:hypothetical protein
MPRRHPNIALASQPEPHGQLRGPHDEVLRYERRFATFTPARIRLSPLWAKASLVGAAVATIGVTPRTASADRPESSVGRVIVIAMENHNFTQPNPTSSPQQILGNPAAPFINRLITPGNPNAAQVSYATNYHNAGVGEHPSEPNYI